MPKIMLTHGQNQQILQLPPGVSTQVSFTISPHYRYRGVNCNWKVQPQYRLTQIGRIDINGKKSEEVAKETRELVEGLDPLCAKTLDGGLGLGPVDVDSNIMTTCCSKNWCFYCIIQSMKKDTKGPNCRTRLTQEKFLKNSLISNIYDQMKIQKKSLNPSMVGKIHKKTLEIYGESCKKWIGVSGITKHYSHKIMPIEDKYSEANDQCSEIIEKIDKKDEELSTQQKGLEYVKLVREVILESVAKPSINEVTQELNLLTDKYIENVKIGIDQTKSLKEKLQTSKKELEAKDTKTNTGIFHAKIQKIYTAEEHLGQEVAIAHPINGLLSVKSEDVLHLKVCQEFTIKNKSRYNANLNLKIVDTLDMKLAITKKKVMLNISKTKDSDIEYHLIKMTHPDSKTSVIFKISDNDLLKLNVSTVCQITEAGNRSTINTNFDILQVNGEVSKHLAQLRRGMLDIYEKGMQKVEQDFVGLIPMDEEES